MKKLFFAFIVLMFPLLVFSQMDAKSILMQRGELYFKFQIAPERLNEISKIVSVDGYRNGTCYAYANVREFAEFRKLGIDCEPVREYYEAKDALQMAESLNDMFAWNVYPTYSIYCEMMQYFATTYPELCKLDTIGTSYSGYKLLAVKISDNVNTDEAEPEFFLGGQMHGDELIGGMVCLRLIDKLLREYGTDQEVTYLVNNMEIFINPLSNPEGTYLFTPDSVNNSIRYTRDGEEWENFYDINRNFPDANAGEHPDGSESYSIETEAFMRYADEHHFVMSANLHSGAELVNYPFDTEQTLPADDAWWQFVSAEYVALARQACNDLSYMTSDFPSGYTNGYAWYTITGSRQDYMNYFKHCREVTLELSLEKKLQNDLLPSYTSRNIPPMMAYMKRATMGLQGFVTDSITGEPLRSMVFVSGHDYFCSQVYSFLPTGEYYRFLKAGHYNVSFYAEGYIHKTIAVDITDNAAQNIDIQLVPGYDPEAIVDESVQFSLYPNPVSDKLYIGSSERFSSLEIYDVSGKLMLSKNDVVGIVDVSMLQRGQYLLKLISGDGNIVKTKFVKM